MPKTPNKNYETRNAERKRREQDRLPTPIWWLKQREPISRFTLYIAFFTLALVGVGALQWCTSQNQLVEMTNQRLTTQAQLRANMRWEQPSLHAVDENGKLRDIGETFSEWEVNPIWENAGSTDALDFRAWFDIRVFEATKGQHIGPSDCPKSIIPVPLPLPKIVAPGGAAVLLAKKLSVKDAIEAQTLPKYILMWGHIEYREVFADTPVHHHDWCVSMIPNDPQRSLFSYLSLLDTAD